MLKFLHHSKNKHFTHWYIKIFSVVSLLFTLALIPITIHLQNTFTTLELQKATNQLNTSILRFDSDILTLANMAQTLYSDSDFLYCLSIDENYDSVSINTRNQIKNTFSGIALPLTLAKDVTLQIDQNVIISTNNIFFADKNLRYYPDFFCVDNLSFSEWTQLLSENNSGFLPVCHVQTNKNEYDALIFLTKFSSLSYIYACFDISVLSDLLLENSIQEQCYVSISTSEGTCLYSNLPDENSNYKTITQYNSIGNLKISVHIPNNLFYTRMQPLYAFLLIYFSCCLLLLVVTTLIGSRISARPLYNVINYANSKIGNYENTINTQKKILRVRYIEKAISGRLVNSNDIALFKSFFPDFPTSYCLTLFRLQLQNEENKLDHSNPLLLLQNFFQPEMPDTYIQQINTSDLLLVIPETNYKEYCKFITFVMTNIHNEEPAYSVSCVSSDFYTHIENLAEAYNQVQNMIEFKYSEEQNHIHTPSDRPIIKQTPFTISDLMTLYTAITHGNKDMALSTMNMLSDELSLAQNSRLDRHVYELVRTTLSCIILEHPLQLYHQHIPAYQPNVLFRENASAHQGNNQYKHLTEKVEIICDLIKDTGKGTADSLAKELLYYIDTHYTDYDISLTSISDYFNLSSSTIRKVFKEMTDTTITKYIEQKRLNHANLLLVQKEKSIEEIALECGYTNANSFYKAYKRVHGHAPTLQL